MTDQAPHPITSFMLRLESTLVTVLTALLTVVFGLIFIMVMVLVVMRYGFNTAIVGGNEATVLLFIYTTALGSAVEIAKGKHIRIDSLVGLLPPFWRNASEAIQLVLIGALHIFLLVFSVQWISVVGSSTDPVLRTPEWVVEIAIPIGCGLAVLFCITRLFNLVLAAPNAVDEAP